MAHGEENAPASFSLPASGGLHALTVTTDASHLVLRVTVQGGADESVDVPGPFAVPSSRVSVTSVDVGDGKKLARVRITSPGSSEEVAWEALVAGREPAVLWSGTTGYGSGQAGERTGEWVELVSKGGGDERVVVVGDVREDLRICDEPRTLLTPRALDPTSMTFRSATMQRLPEAQRDGAEEVVASAHRGPASRPLARLLVAGGASTAIGAPANVTDGDPSTTWSEARPSDGHGEFVVMRAPEEVPLTRLAITIAPPMPSPSGAAPRSFFLVADHRTFEVTLPEDAWVHPGESYDVAFVDPLRTSCLALVLDQAYARPKVAHPDVTVADVAAYSSFDAPNASLDEVASALGGGGPRAESAKGVLERAGDAGVAAAAKAYPSLDAPGRALAVDAAISAGACEESAAFLLRAMGDGDREVARKGREKLERCGRRAVSALLAALKGPDDRARAEAAQWLASAAPAEALDPLAAQLGKGDASTRAAVRGGLARAARTAAREKLAALMHQATDANAKLELLRALDAELTSIAAEGGAAVEALASGAPDLRLRYLLVGPMAALAKGGDASMASLLARTIARDADAAVRAHAAEASAGIAVVKDALGRAADADDSPRVREAALRALAADAPPLPVDILTKRLHEDDWTFVRAAAAAALRALPPNPKVDSALTGALHDGDPGVREAAIEALAARGDTHAAKEIRGLLADEHETLEVRLAAVNALAALCDADSLELFTKLARRAPLPMASDEDIDIGVAAAEALGRLHPVDLGGRLSPLGAKDAPAECRVAAARALATASSCR